MIVQKEIDEQQVVDIVIEIVNGIQSDVANLELRVDDIETEIGQLTFNSSLQDVDMTGLIAGKIAKWDGTLWVPSDDSSGVPEPPNTGLNYV